MPGDAADFVRTGYASLRGFAYTICGSLFDADELAQLAVIEVWRRWESVSAHPHAYARKVIVTRNVSRWRHLRRESLVEDLDVYPDDPAAERVSDLALWNALHHLKLKDRTIVVLHVLYRYTFAEIADLLNDPRGTVSSSYTRAVRVLRDYLSAPLASEPDGARPRKCDDGRRGAGWI